MARPRSPSIYGRLVVFAFKVGAVALMIGTPLLGVWVASSLAAFANRATWLPVAAGALLFPGLPLAWEGWARLRERKHPPRKRFLTLSDRVVLRTLAINFVFLAGLLAAYPQRAFVALSARGDWMLDGRHGPTVERARRALFTSAGALEWLYEATRKNPYRKPTDDGRSPVPPPSGSSSAAPSPSAPTSGSAPTASSQTPGPAPSSSASPSPSPTPQAATPAARRWPLPAELHPAVVSMPREVETSLGAVARYLKDHEPDPMMRVKALHDYVADRVAYDAPAYLAHAIPLEDGDPEAVFRSRKGVCAGYAALLAEMGKVTGDEIVYVVGDARSELAPMEGEGHAWNAARIEGTWYLIDATWDAGHVKGGAFEKKYGTEYLFTPPEAFAVQHYPDEDRWQLLAQPLARSEFFRRPVLAPSFHAYGLRLRSPDRSQVSAGAGIDLDVENPGSTFLLADYEPKGGGARKECAGDGHRSFHCAFSNAGSYDVRLYVNREQYGHYAYGGSVEVNARP